jgi:hypothetical protein
MAIMAIRHSTEAKLRKLAQRTGAPLCALMDAAIHRLDRAIARGEVDREEIRDRRRPRERD